MNAVARCSIAVAAFGGLALLVALEPAAQSLPGLSATLSAVHASTLLLCSVGLLLAPSWFQGVILVGLVLITVFGVASVARQLIHARRLADDLARIEISSLPGGLRRMAARAGVGYRIRLLDTSEFGAFCSGFLRPEIWISTGVLGAFSTAEVEAILRHEAWHTRQRDPLKVLVVNAIGAAFFFVPFVGDWGRSYVVATELRADAAAVRDMENVLPLASALYRAISANSLKPQIHAAVGAFNAIDARIDQLVGASTPAVTSRARSLPLVVGLVAGVFLMVLFCFIVSPP